MTYVLLTKSDNFAYFNDDKIKNVLWTIAVSKASNRFKFRYMSLQFSVLSPRSFWIPRSNIIIHIGHSVPPTSLVSHFYSYFVGKCIVLSFQIRILVNGMWQHFLFLWKIGSIVLKVFQKRFLCFCVEQAGWIIWLCRS